MKRISAGLGVLACLVASPVAPSAAAGIPTLPLSSLAKHGSGVATGTVTAVDGTSFTIQTAGRRTGVINALTAAANTVTNGDYPYVYGGGHAQASVASVGIRGPGYNGRRRGFDCSGSVAAVLAGAGLWPAGGPVPNDAGIIAQLRSEGLISPGPGRAPDEVTLYDNPGIHIFMNIDGRFFGTSDGGAGNPNQRHGGAGWLYDGAPDAHSRVYKQYHLLPAVLRDRATYGHVLTFGSDPNATGFAGLAVGDRVRVGYAGTGSGAMIATAVGYLGAVTVTGTVQSVAGVGVGGSFTVQPAQGPALTFATGNAGHLADGLQVGATVSVTYTRGDAGELTARAITVIAAPASGFGPGATPGPGSSAGPTANVPPGRS